MTKIKRFKCKMDAVDVSRLEDVDNKIDAAREFLTSATNELKAVWRAIRKTYKAPKEATLKVDIEKNILKEILPGDKE